MATPTLTGAVIVDNSRSNTATAGAASTITLDIGASTQAGFHEGCDIEITGGTGFSDSDRRRYITAYSAARVATVSYPWVTTPDATTTFTIYNGNHVQLTFDLASTYNAGVATAYGDAVVHTTDKRIVPMLGTPVYGDATTTPVIRVQPPDQAASGNMRSGMGLPFYSGETVTIDLPADLFRNGVDGNVEDLANAVTNNSTLARNGTVHIVSDWVGEDKADATLAVEVRAFHSLGFNNVTITADDGVSAVQSSGALTSKTQVIDANAPWGKYWAYRWSGIDQTALNDGLVTVTATLNSDYGTQTDTEYYYNDNGGTMATASTIYYCKSDGDNASLDGTVISTPYRHPAKAIDHFHVSGGSGRLIIECLDAADYDATTGTGGVRLDLSINARRPVIVRGASGLAMSDVQLIGQPSGTGAFEYFIDKTKYPSGLAIFDIPAMIFKNCTHQLRRPVGADRTELAQLALASKFCFDHRTQYTSTHRSIHQQTTQDSWIPTSQGNIATWYYGTTITSTHVATRWVRKLVNCKFVGNTGDHVRELQSNGCIFNCTIENKGAGMPMMDVRYTPPGAQTTATIEFDVALIDTASGTLILRVDGTPVLTLDTSLAANNTWAKIIALIDAETDWTATNLDALGLMDNVGPFMYSFGVTDNPYSDQTPLDCFNNTQTIYTVSGIHADNFQQTFSGNGTVPRSNLSVENLVILAGATPHPGETNGGHQMWWFDHVGFVEHEDFDIIGCSLPSTTYSETNNPIVRASIQNVLRNLTIMFNTFPNQAIGILHSVGTAGAKPGISGLFIAANSYYGMQDEPTATGYADMYHDRNHGSSVAFTGIDNPGTNPTSGTWAESYAGDVTDPALGATALVPIGAQIGDLTGNRGGVPFADQSAVTGPGIGAWPPQATATGGSAFIGGPFISL